MLYIYTDGASRNNPGKSASGYQIYDKEHKLLDEHYFYNGIRTNNEAEYLAVIAALEKAGKTFGFESTEVLLSSDSQLIVNQLNGKYRVKEADLKVLHETASRLKSRFKKCEIANVRRENKYISLVDKELNNLLDRTG